MILSKVFKSFKFQVAAKFSYIESPVFSTHSKRHRIYLESVTNFVSFHRLHFFPQERETFTHFLAAW